MSNVFHLAAKIRAVPPYLATEDEAIEVAKAIAERIASRSNRRGHDRILPYDEMALVAQSGLLGVTVSSEYGGTDISNASLAELIAILSEADSSVGQIPQSHFYILEALRLAGSDAQKQYFFARALAGEYFADVLTEAEPTASEDIAIRLIPDGVGYRISGRGYCSPGALFADWMAIFCLDPQNRIVMAIVPRQTEGLAIVDEGHVLSPRAAARGGVVIDNIYVSQDAVIDHYRNFERHVPLGALGQLLLAAVDLGIARSSFAEMIRLLRTGEHGSGRPHTGAASGDQLTIARTGSIAIKIEAACALLERAGRKVDVAQIDQSQETAIEASIAVAAAKSLTADAALEANRSLDELADPSPSKGEPGLDCHWPDARMHTLHDPVRWKHYAIGDFHLNGKVPRPNGQF